MSKRKRKSEGLVLAWWTAMGLGLGLIAGKGAVQVTSTGLDQHAGGELLSESALTLDLHGGALNLIEAALDAGCLNVVFSSTCATYGDQDGVMLDETSPQRPINAYGASKRAIEDMLTDFGVAGKPDIHVMRSLRHLGIWPDPKDQITTEEALAINRAIRKMVLRTGEMTPARMRRVDIELMSLSRHGVIPT